MVYIEKKTYSDRFHKILLRNHTVLESVTCYIFFSLVNLVTSK